MAAIGRFLFARLREADSLGVDVILARPVAEQAAEGGIGLAIRDRLFRAAEGCAMRQPRIRLRWKSCCVW